VASVADAPKVAARSGYAGVLVAAASWGTWALFLRQARASGPVAAELCSFVVMSTIAVVLCPLALSATRQAQRRNAKEWWLIGAFGLSDALNCVLYFAALQTTSVAIAVLTHYLAPLVVALGAPLALGERRRRGMLLAVALGLFGLTLLVREAQPALETALALPPSR
jgi:DME family drug/metabolite transporter